jgi:hypothetical protein
VSQRTQEERKGWERKLAAAAWDLVILTSVAWFCAF